MQRRVPYYLYAMCALFVFMSGFVITLTWNPSQAQAATSKNLVLIGGGLDSGNEQIYNTIVQLAGGPGVARIGIITAAAEPLSQAEDANDSSLGKARGYIQNFITGYKAAVAQWIPIDLDNIKNNSDPDVIRQINSMTGFFFGGGQQTRLIESFYLNDRSESPALAAIRAKFEQGAVVAGSSAGAAVQTSAGVLTPGGESYEALRFGTFSEPTRKKDYMYYDPTGGFEFFSYGLIDTHYSERGRQGRMIRMAIDTEQKRGFGIDEDTALVVTDVGSPTTRMKVIGTGGVTITDLSQAQVETGKYVSISGVDISYLTQDDVYIPETNSVEIAAWKTPLAGREQYSSVRASSDIFSSPDDDREGAGEFTEVAIQLFDSKLQEISSRTYESKPAFRVQMLKTENRSTGYSGERSSGIHYSFVHLNVNISA